MNNSHYIAVGFFGGKNRAVVMTKSSAGEISTIAGCCSKDTGRFLDMYKKLESRYRAAEIINLTF